MNSQLNVQYAVACLKQLGDSQASGMRGADLGRLCGVPSDVLPDLLERLCQAGLVSVTEEGLYRLTRALEELTALEVLQAVWTEPKKQTPFRLLYQAARGATRKTLEAVAFAQSLNAYPGEAA
jgi:DNA-binding IscR family transcriptional regulator